MHSPPGSLFPLPSFLAAAYASSSIFFLSFLFMLTAHHRFPSLSPSRFGNYVQSANQNASVDGHSHS
jgi:hypothetical protein